MSTNGEHEIRLKRAYDPPATSDGTRILVDRLWPRGVAKPDLRLDLWLKDIAPSDGLRKWYHKDTDKWDEFQRRYRKELADHEDLVQAVEERMAEGTVTLIYSAKDAERNNAVVLKRYLEERS